MYLLICLINGLIGGILPFWDWFDGSKNKVRFLPCPHERANLSAEMAYRYFPLYDLLTRWCTAHPALFASFCSRYCCFHT